MNKFNTIFYPFLFSFLTAIMCCQVIRSAKETVSNDIDTLKTLSLRLIDLKNDAGKHKPAEKKEKLKPTIIDAYGTRCGPCRVMAPIFDKLKQELGSKYNFEKLDIDTTDVVDRYNLSSIPTFIFLKNNEEVGRITGKYSEQDLRAKIIQYLG